MRIVIDFNMDGAAVADDPAYELRTAFDRVASLVINGNVGPSVIRDSNGAKFAEWERRV